MITKTKTFLNEPYELYFKLLENKNNKSKLLEIGAGTGQNTGFLIDMSYKVCATDISLEFLEVMNKKFHRCINSYRFQQKHLCCKAVRELSTLTEFYFDILERLLFQLLQ